MRFSSSGLGQRELKGNMVGLSTVGKDLLVLKIQTYEPVEWQMRAALERKDVPQIIKGILKPSILFHTIRVLFSLKKNPKEPEDLLKLSQ